MALPTHAADPDSLSKVVDEQTAAAVNRRFGTTVVMLRLPFVGVADPDDPQGMARRIDGCTREPERWVRELWSCLEVRDAARALRLALSPADDGVHTVFVADAQTAAPYPTEALLDTFLPGVPRRQTFPGRQVPIDLEPIREVLGFEAAHAVQSDRTAVVSGQSRPATVMARRNKSQQRGVPTPAVLVASEAEIDYQLHTYAHDPAADLYGQEAAHALNVAPARVFKTLLATTGSGLVVGVVPVSSTLDLKALARATGAKSLTMAEPTVAERATGYVVGGISPLGQRTASLTVIDTSAATFTTILVSAGRRGLEIELSVADLMMVTGGRLADIARDG